MRTAQRTHARGDTTGQACDTASQACDTVRLDHDTTGEGATTRPSERHDTASCARGLCSQPGLGCAPGAPNPFLTQCTVFSHCLNHCS